MKDTKTGGNGSLSGTKPTGLDSDDLPPMWCFHRVSTGR